MMVAHDETEASKVFKGDGIEVGYDGDSLKTKTTSKVDATANNGSEDLSLQRHL